MKDGVSKATFCPVKGLRPLLYPTKRYLHIDMDYWNMLASITIITYFSKWQRRNV